MALESQDMEHRKNGSILIFAMGATSDMGVSANKGCTHFWGLYNEGPTIQGTIFASPTTPIFGNPPYSIMVSSDRFGGQKASIGTVT